jgi:predicted GIY-YIG superfamily endonuclease
MSKYLKNDNRRFYVYKMYDENEELLYVGKTTRFDARMIQHFSKDAIEKQAWKEDVAYIDYYEFKTKVDMDIMELYYIALERPKHNELSTDTEKPQISIIYTCKEPKRINKKPIKQKIIEINIDKEIKKQMLNNLNIYEGRINDIGKKKNSKIKQPLTRTWFMENDEETLKQLMNNITNYFKNKAKGESKYNCWTTYEEYEKQINGKGYTKGFVNPDCELSKLDNCKNFAYIMNKYPSDIEKDNDKYANLLTIYDLIRIVKYITVDLDHKLNLYVPSERVRTLFKEWLVS